MITDDDATFVTWEEWLAMPSDDREPFELTGRAMPVSDKNCSHYFTVKPDEVGLGDIHDALEHLDGRHILVTIELLD